MNRRARIESLISPKRLICSAFGKCLLVNKRRGKEEDQSAKASKSENREQVSSEVVDTGSNQVTGSGNIGEISNIIDHVDLGLPGDEGGADCEKQDERSNKSEP